MNLISPTSLLIWKEAENISSRLKWVEISLATKGRHQTKHNIFMLLINLFEEFYEVLSKFPHLLGGIPRKLGANGDLKKDASNAKHHSKDKLAVNKKDVNSASPGIFNKPASLREENGEKYPVSSRSVHSPQTPKASQSVHSPQTPEASQSIHSPQTPKENKRVSHSLSLEDYHKRKGNEQHKHKQKLPAKSNIQQQVVNKALNDQNRDHKHASSNSLDLHSKSEPLERLASVSVSSSTPQSTAATVGLANPLQLANPFDIKHPVPAKNIEPTSVTNSQVVKYQSHKRKPSRDINTNVSKESNSNKRRNAVVENNVVVKMPEMSSTHKKYETERSYKSSSEDEVVSSEPSNRASMVVKIKLEKIKRLPEKKPKSQSSVKVGSTSQPLGFSTSKLPVPTGPVATTKPDGVKIVISKDKSGIYRTSHKNKSLRDHVTGGKENSRKLLSKANDLSDRSLDYIDVVTCTDKP